MACFHPVKAVQLEDGSVKFSGVMRGRQLILPCGQCIGCRMERSRQWAVRCLHESQMHDESCFITLTYSEDKLESPVLDYTHFQLFMKRLRKRCGAVRFYMCGEYGGEGGRPHFHALLFGYGFPDRQYFGKLPSGSLMFRSAELEALWPYGYSSIGAITFDSAAYVARYACKSALEGHDGKRRSVKLGFVDANTGEFTPFVPEFTRMSLKPGIGATWFEKYKADVFGRDGGKDHVVVRGSEALPPRYYDKLLERVDGFSREYVAFMRMQRGEARMEDNTPARLAVREAVSKARLSLKNRGLS